MNFRGNTTFERNSARKDVGGIDVLDNSDVSFSGSTTFEGNSARQDGGGIHAQDSSKVSFSSSTTLEGNYADKHGGGTSAKGNTNVSFCTFEGSTKEGEGLCTNRTYPITSPNTTSRLLLYPTTLSGNSTPAVLNIAFQNCPIGFELSSYNNECICDHRLQVFTNRCNIDSQT